MIYVLAEDYPKALELVRHLDIKGNWTTVNLSLMYRMMSTEYPTVLKYRCYIVPVDMMEQLQTRRANVIDIACMHEEHQPHSYRDCPDPWNCPTHIECVC